MQRLEGHTGKKRLGVALVASTGMMVGLFAAILNGGIGIAGISTSFGLPFKASVGSLTGNGLEQYAWFLKNSLQGGTPKPTVETYLHTATLNNTTQTFCVPLAGGGGVPPILASLIGAISPAAQSNAVPAIELALHADIDATGMLADVVAQNDVTLSGVQANIPFNQTAAQIGNGAAYDTIAVNPPQDLSLNGGIPPGNAASPLTYANQVTNAGGPVDQYISYQYASSLTLHSPTFHLAYGWLYPVTNLQGFDNGNCDWQNPYLLTHGF